LNQFVDIYGRALDAAVRAVAGQRLSGRPTTGSTDTQEFDMTFALAPAQTGPSTIREPFKTLRERETDRFHAALGRVLSAGLAAALEAEDHPRAVSIINRGFAEGTPQLGCDLLCQAIAVVGAARTWTVQIAPLAPVPERSAPRAH
jgi:hypothetical protein